jgi:hypothetical protein
MPKIILKTWNLFEMSSAPSFYTNIMYFPDKKFNKKILLDFIKNKTYKKKLQLVLIKYFLVIFL